jgi:hypothetical protein
MKPELIALIFGFLVSLFAIVSNLLQKRNKREQEKKSVRPEIKIYFSEKTDQQIKIFIKNIGAGPAFINVFEVRVDDIIMSDDKVTSLGNAIKKLGLGSSDIIFNNPSVNEELHPNRNYYLIEANPIDIIEVKKIRNAFSRMKFNIKYSSLYNEIFISTN